jgi:hypothetical protein
MPNMTLALDDATMREIRAHPEIRWTEVARQAFKLKIQELHALDLAFANSKLTDTDVEELAEKVRRDMWTKHYAPRFGHLVDDEAGR